MIDDGVCYRRAARRLSIRSGLKTRRCKSTCICFANISRAKSIKVSERDTPVAVEAEQNLRSCSRTKPGCQSGPALLQILPRTYVDALGAGGTHLLATHQNSTHAVLYFQPKVTTDALEVQPLGFPFYFLIFCTGHRLRRSRNLRDHKPTCHHVQLQPGATSCCCSLPFPDRTFMQTM